MPTCMLVDDLYTTMACPQRLVLSEVTVSVLVCCYVFACVCCTAFKGEFKSGGIAGVRKTKDEVPSKHGRGSIEVHLSIWDRDVVNSKPKPMHAKEVAILNQYNDRWPSTPTPP